MNNWSMYRDNFYRQTLKLGSGPKMITSTDSGSVVMLHSKFDAFRGTGSAQPYTSIALCTGGGGRTRKEGKGIFLDDFWLPGKLGFSMPHPIAPEGFTPEMETLAVAFNPEGIPFCHSEDFDVSELGPLGRSLFNDELIESVMIAMLKDAEAHGASSAFFDHALSLILNRLRKKAKASSTSGYPILSSNKNNFNDVLYLIDTELEQDLKVKDMAEVLNLSPRNFTRLFKRKTGFTPFMYLTRQRMLKAQSMLQQGASVTETAMTVGYANPAKFAAAFKRWLGQTPSQWQKQQMN